MCHLTFTTPAKAEVQSECLPLADDSRNYLNLSNWAPAFAGVAWEIGAGRDQ